MTPARSSLFLMVFISASIAVGQPPQTRSVFVVCIDGIRNQDGLESGSRAMPFLWDSLRPQGSLYENVQNRGITVTNAGHNTIVTGVRQALPNNSGIPTPVRPQEPTMGEYYRKELGIPSEKVYYVSGKSSIWKYPVSLFPGYGYAVAPTITLTSSKDTLTWDSTRVIMDRDHPSLIYVLFAQVDAEGHTGDSVKYFGAIRRVDSLIYLLWRKIQADSVYRGRTTMFVTGDHGRHDDPHGGWRAHGDYCHGCRHIPFFAIGPDIRAGEVISAVRDQVDILPTVAYLLGFRAPLAHGTIMSEMLLSPPPPGGGGSLPGVNEQNISGGAVALHPSVTANSLGVHAAFAAGLPGTREIRYTRSTDCGATWSPAGPLFFRPGTEYFAAALTSFGDCSLFAATTGYRYFEADSSYGWILEGRRSTDGGVTWESSMVLDTLTTISTRPSLASSGNLVNLTAMMGYRVWNYTSTDGGLTFTAKQVHAANSTTPTCALLDTAAFVAWRHLNKDSLPYWNILYDRKPWRARDHPVTSNDANSYSYLPSLTGDGDSVLQLVYVHLADASSGNEWRIQHQRKRGTGDEWEPARQIAPGRTTWSPVITQAVSGDLHTVWADLEGGQWSIRSSISTDHGLTWEPSVPRSSPQPLALHPAIATKGDTVFVVWEDWRSGSPEIYFTHYAVYQTRHLSCTAGWNLISLPVDPQDHSAEGLGLCGGAFCYLYGYGGSGYTQVDSLELLRGYWWRVDYTGLAAMRGRPVSSDTAFLDAGWNLVGGVSETVPAAGIVSIPSGNIQWPAFGYGGSGYQPSWEILPGRGHWIKAQGPGLLVFPSTAGRR